MTEMPLISWDDEGWVELGQVDQTPQIVQEAAKREKALQHAKRQRDTFAHHQDKNGRWRTRTGKFAKDPNRRRVAKQVRQRYRVPDGFQSVRFEGVAVSEHQWPGDEVWLSTGPNSTIPTTPYITYGGTTTGSTNQQVWNQWRGNYEWRTAATAATSFARATERMIDAQRPIVDDMRRIRDRWHVIAERDRRLYAEIEDAEAHRREREERLRVEAQARREEESRRALARAEKMAGAQERALGLLRMILSPEELVLWEQTGMIHVRGSEGGLYEIDTTRTSVHGNIYEVDEHGCRLVSLCGAPQMYHQDPELGSIGLPLADGWIGQYLTLKNNEGEMKRKANPGRRFACQHPGVPIIGATQVA